VKRRARQRIISTISMGLAALALTLSGGVASAARVPGHIFALPGAASAGFANRIVVITKGSPVQFHNLDVAPHNVWSVAPGRFMSATVGLGKTTKVVGTERLAKGNYAFYCTVHPSTMRGNLIVK